MEYTVIRFEQRKPQRSPLYTEAVVGLATVVAFFLLLAFFYIAF